MNTKIALESLSLDLKRVALGYHRGSDKMAKRFCEEAMKRKEEINYSEIKPYVQTLLNKMESQLNQTDKNSVAEDSLLLSIIFQNYSQYFFKT